MWGERTPPAWRWTRVLIVLPPEAWKWFLETELDWNSSLSSSPGTSSVTSPSLCFLGPVWVWLGDFLPLPYHIFSFPSSVGSRGKGLHTHKKAQLCFFIVKPGNGGGKPASVCCVSCALRKPPICFGDSLVWWSGSQKVSMGKQE